MQTTTEKKLAAKAAKAANLSAADAASLYGIGRTPAIIRVFLKAGLLPKAEVARILKG